jgi:hypothetical protein
MPKGECSPEYAIVPANIEYYQKTTPLQLEKLEWLLSEAKRN